MSRNYMDFGGLERELEDEHYRDEVRQERRELAAQLAVRYVARIHRGDGVTFLAGIREVRFEHEAEGFATPDAALDAGFLFVMRSPGCTHDVLDREDRK